MGGGGQRQIRGGELSVATQACLAFWACSLLGAGAIGEFESAVSTSGWRGEKGDKGEGAGSQGRNSAFGVRKMNSGMSTPRLKLTTAASG